MKIRAAGLFVCLLAAAPVAAQQQRPPSAAEFQALVNQLTALTARVAQLESGAVTNADIIGNWRMFWRGLEMYGGAQPSVGDSFAQFDITFLGDNTGTVTFNGATSDLLLGPLPFLERETQTFTGEFLWEIAGSAVILNFPNGGQLVWTVGAGGRTAVAGDASTGGNNSGSWSVVSFGVKLP
jgi:hypothetical protein